MELSLFLAQLIGSMLAIFSLAAIMRPQLITAALRDFDHESFSTLAIGLMSVGFGLAVVLTHNVWDGSWRVWITLAGWSAFLKGCAYLINPHGLITMSRTMLRNKTQTTAFLGLTLLLGLYLAYKGFGF